MQFSLFQMSGDSGCPHGGELSEHDGDEEQEEAALHLDARHAAGFHREHKNGDDEDVEHGPLAHVGNELEEGFGLFSSQSAMKPEGEQSADLHDGEADGKHEQDEKQKDFAFFEQGDESLKDGNLVLENPELGHRGEGEKNPGDEEAECEQEHKHDCSA